ncbi:hypothetical protein KNT81_gp220 [Proteus phage phiP4-3]|uniref:Uncharacterized protein n=1 Tax=Proteus phage phiP4-3 TaxID=2065203 RepID=A0A2I6PFR5_9CAUD|nr:hypothetical protein KNT81_gp220 [Proteus phage phiP4-3]AUM58551.1 hypothetical protein phiP43_193 [Proteus phage phiP4-3]
MWIGNKFISDDFKAGISDKTDNFIIEQDDDLVVLSKEDALKLKLIIEQVYQGA